MLFRSTLTVFVRYLLHHSGEILRSGVLSFEDRHSLIRYGDRAIIMGYGLLELKTIHMQYLLYYSPL